MTVYTPRQVYETINAEYRKHNGKDIPYQQGIVYTGIVLKESGGDSQALNANDSGSPSRGWWQIREVNHPTVTAAMAFDPLQATAYAYKISNGFDLNGVDPWIGPGRDSIGDEFGTNANRFQAFYKAIGAAAQVGAFDASTDNVNRLYASLGIPLQVQENSDSGFDDSGDFGPFNVPGKIVDGVEAGVGAITGGFDAVGDLVSTIMNPTFWKRVGIGALGLLVVLVAVAIYLAGNSPAAQVGKALEQ